MKSTDLYRLIKITFPNVDLKMSDVDYALPKASWLTGTFYDFYRAWRFDHNLNEWSTKNDCDNFASLFFAFAQICHAKGDRVEEGIAVGQMFYGLNGDRTKSHSINVAVTDKGVIAIEPQTGKLVQLSKAEKDCVYFVII